MQSCFLLLKKEILKTPIYNVLFSIRHFHPVLSRLLSLPEIVLGQRPQGASSKASRLCYSHTFTYSSDLHEKI